MKAHRPDKDTGSTPAPAKQAAENDHGGQTDREVYLRRAQAVVDQSNEDKDDAFWHAMNGENKGVEKDGTTKPDEWYRGVKLEGDQVKGLHGGNTGDVKTIEQFRTQISEDLNFNDAFTNFKSVEAFESATVKRYAAGGDDKRVAQVTHIARNLWAYAKTGMDVGGKTNIAELQGMLYSLDTMIRDASMSNTPHEGSFEIPGAEGVELDSLGDGFYGRASILECRMIADLIKEMPVEEKTILELVEETVPRKEEEPVEEYVTRLDNFDETKFIVDMSASMSDNFKDLSKYIGEHSFGNTTLGGMTDWDKPVNWSASSDLSQEAVQDLLKGAKNKGSGARDKLVAKDNAFTDFGDGASESSIHQALMTVRQIVAAGGPPKNHQIIVASDESDMRPMELKTLRDEARAAKITVKVLQIKSDSIQEIVINDISDAVLKRYDGEHGGLEVIPENERKSNARAHARAPRLSWTRLAKMMEQEL